MTLEFYIKMKEMMSSGLVKMANTAQTSFNRVSQLVNNVTGRNRILSQSFDEISRKATQLEQVVRSSNIPSQIRAARRELEGLQRMANNHPGNMSKSGGMLSGIFGSLLPAVTLAGAMALGGNVVGAGLQQQARQTSFEVLAGKEQGTALNKNLTKYAQDSIYGNEVFQNAQTMMGFGIDAEKVMPTMKMLGDISMGNVDRLGRLTLAFSQVKAAGRLMGQDLLQFVNAGFNPLQEISLKTGISIGTLKEKMEEGQISFAMVEAAFQSATGAGGRFFEMTEKIGKTDFGKWQAFKGQLQGLAMEVGGMLAPAFGEFITNVLVPLVRWMSEAAKWIQENWNWVGLLASVLGAAVIAYKGVILVTKLWAAAQTLLNVALSLNPIGLIIAAIAALVAGIVWAWNKFEGFRQVIWGFWEVCKQVFSNIGSFFGVIFEPIFAAIEAIKDGRFIDAGKAVAKLLYNISPVGFIANIATFAGQGGFTKGVADAWQRGQERGKNKSEAQAAAEAATPGGNTMPNPAFDGLKDDAESVAKGAVSGGPRVINIYGVKFAENFVIHQANAQESRDEIEKHFEEMFLRLLNSGASVQ